MNTLTNTVHLIGNLGKDVQVFDFESGSKKAAFTLATSDIYKNQKGELVKNTTWHNIIAWGKNAELMSKILAKGSKVAIQGTINNRTYEDKDGQSKSITEILVHEFMKISGSTTKVEEREVAPF